MTRICKLGGTQVGDLVTKVWPEQELLTPPAALTGALRQTPVIVFESVNRLYRLRVIVTLTREDEIAFDAALSAILARQGEQAAVQILDETTPRISGDSSWYFLSADPDEPPEGYGGRHGDVHLTFIGTTPPTYSGLS